MTSITLNAAHHRFEVTEDGATAYVAFERSGDVITFTHTIVPDALGGRGLGSALARHVLDYAAEHQLRVCPQCSFIRGYIAKHPEYAGLVTA